MGVTCLGLIVFLRPETVVAASRRGMWAQNPHSANPFWCFVHREIPHRLTHGLPSGGAVFLVMEV